MDAGGSSKDSGDTCIYLDKAVNLDFRFLFFHWSLILG